MPYYCTVPRCTSMAGKAKNVSFHQFPRDEELAKLWNRILKRGKPYTKYSKVCSLHFKPEDYTITSVGKNKGQWRTLRKDAIPSQNLPSDSPVPYTPRRHSSGWGPGLSSNLVDPMVQQQMAQAIYMQTMLAMQAAGASESNANDQPSHSEAHPSPSGSSLSEIELLLRCKPDTEQKDETYQCQECSKCFKDPDVFKIHKRVHSRGLDSLKLEKENFSANIQHQETLRANPILANLLKSSLRLEPDNINNSDFEANVLSVENQIMTALASNMEAYIRTLSSMLASQNKDKANINEKCDDIDDNAEIPEDTCNNDDNADICEEKCDNIDDTGDCARENDSGSVKAEMKNSEIGEYNMEITVSVTNECEEECENDCSENVDDENYSGEKRIGVDNSEFEGVSENYQATSDCDNDIDPELNKD